MVRRRPAGFRIGTGSPARSTIRRFAAVLLSTSVGLLPFFPVVSSSQSAESVAKAEAAVNGAELVPEVTSTKIEAGEKIAHPGARPLRLAEQCFDGNRACEYWAGVGECERNTAFMFPNCRRACGVCRVRDEQHVQHAQESAAGFAIESEEGFGADRATFLYLQYERKHLKQLGKDRLPDEEKEDTNLGERVLEFSGNEPQAMAREAEGSALAARDGSFMGASAADDAEGGVGGGPIVLESAPLSQMRPGTAANGTATNGTATKGEASTASGASSAIDLHALLAAQLADTRFVGLFPRVWVHDGGFDADSFARNRTKLAVLERLARPTGTAVGAAPAVGPADVAPAGVQGSEAEAGAGASAVQASAASPEAIEALELKLQGLLRTANGIRSAPQFLKEDAQAGDLGAEAFDYEAFVFLGSSGGLVFPRDCVSATLDGTGYAACCAEGRLRASGEPRSEASEVVVPEPGDFADPYAPALLVPAKLGRVVVLSRRRPDGNTVPPEVARWGICPGEKRPTKVVHIGL